MFRIWCRRKSNLSLACQQRHQRARSKSVDIPLPGSFAVANDGRRHVPCRKTLPTHKKGFMTSTFAYIVGSARCGRKREPDYGVDNDELSEFIEIGQGCNGSVDIGSLVDI